MFNSGSVFFSAAVTTKAAVSYIDVTIRNGSNVVNDPWTYKTQKAQANGVYKVRLYSLTGNSFVRFRAYNDNNSPVSEEKTYASSNLNQEYSYTYFKTWVDGNTGYVYSATPGNYYRLLFTSPGVNNAVYATGTFEP